MSEIATAVEAGDAAPDFDLARDGEGRARLADLRGKHVILYFYPKDDTPACTTQAKDFTTLADAFADLGAVVVGVSKDTVARHDKFVAKHDLTLILASDPDGVVASSYGVWGERKLYGKTYLGVERSTFWIDPDGRVAQVWRKVKAPGHAEAVLAAVKAAQA